MTNNSPYTPHTHNSIAQGVFPIDIPESLYNQWLRKFDREVEAHGLDVSQVDYAVDGLNVKAIMLSPREMPDGGLPLVIFNRGGSGEYGKITVLQLNNLLIPLAAKGYIVLAPQYRGNDGGEGSDQFGGDDVHDVTALLSQFQNISRDDVPKWDGKNSYMIGFSRGGMMTTLAIKHGAKLNAAVSVAGLFDLPKMMGEHSDMRGTFKRCIGFENDAELQIALEERSAIFWPEKIAHVPLQIQHGDVDDRVGIDQAHDLIGKLEALGAPHECIVHEGGDHYLNRQREAVIDHADAWFRKYKK